MAPPREDLDYRSVLASAPIEPGSVNFEPALCPAGPAAMHTGFQTVDGIRVRCAESEGPADRTILLTSPWPESVYAFAPIWPSLAARFRLFAVDLPGFGASERSTDLLSPQAMGEFLVRLIDECHLGCPHLVGPDVGTPAALFAAAASPGSVASLVVGGGAAAVPIQLGEPLRAWALDPDLERFRSIDPAAIVSAALDTVEGHALPPAIREDYLESYAGDRFVESMHYVRRYPDELPILARRLAEIETPVLIIAGLRDRIMPLANAEFLAERLAHSRLTTIDAGHFVWEEAADEYVALITAWATHGFKHVEPGAA